MFCFDIPLLLFTALRTAAMARRKGHSGILFGLLHAAVAFVAEVAGTMVGLLIGFRLNPFLDKSSAWGPLLIGAAGGLAFGVALMFVVVAMLPAPESDRPRLRFRAVADPLAPHIS